MGAQGSEKEINMSILFHKGHGFLYILWDELKHF